MLDTGNDFRPVSREAQAHLRDALTFTHPDDVLRSRGLSTAQKRAFLAAWASDAHAVPNLPAMRQLDSGAIVSVDTVLEALRTLDQPEEAPRPPLAKPLIALPLRWRRPPRRRNPNDDDPPPCPASALPPGVELELRRRRDARWGLAAA